MQVSLNLHSTNGRIWQNQNVKNTNLAVSKANTFNPILLTFGGNRTNHIAIITAECGGIVSTGGVGTVAQDFAQGKLFNAEKVIENGKEVIKGDKPILILPYYNGKVFSKLKEEHNLLPETRFESEYSSVNVQTKNGKPVFTAESLQPKGLTIDDIDNSKIKELELVATKKMDFNGQQKDIALYKVKGVNNMDAYMVYTEATARMRKPYEGFGGYSSKLRPLGEADPYAEFSKACVELMPELKKQGINPRHVLLNDAQCGYITEYINQKNLSGASDYLDVKLSYVMHNAGLGYQQRIDAKTMALNFVSNEDYEKLKNSPAWNSLTEAQKTRVYRESVKSFSTDDNATSAAVIALRHCDNGSLVTHCSTVSPGYAEAVTRGNGSADGIKGLLRRMYLQGNFSGITNGLDTQDFGPQFLYDNNNVDRFDTKLKLTGFNEEALKERLKSKSDVKIEDLVKPVDKKALEKELGDLKSVVDLKEKLPQLKKEVSQFASVAQENLTADQIAKKDKLKAMEEQFAAIKTEIENDVKAEFTKAGKTIDGELKLSQNEIFSRKFAKINEANGMLKSESVIQKIVNSDNNKASYYLQPFEKYSANMSTTEIIAAKQRNLQNLLTRIYLHNNANLPVEYVSLKDKAGCKILGDIDPSIIKRMQDGKKVTSFVAWGRADLQKALDVTIDSYIKFCNNHKDIAQNTVLIMGGSLKDSPVEKDIRSKIELAKQSCKGHFIYMDGFAPNKVLSSAGQAPLIPSNWAPCELTDLEPMKYGGTPIVTGLEGLDDKNFDFRKDPKGTGYKTTYTANTVLENVNPEKLKSEEAKAALSEYLTQKSKIIEEKRNELRSILFEGNSSYNPSEVEYRLNLFINASETSGDLKDLKFKATNALVTDDIVEAMTERASLKAEDEVKMVRNALDMKSRWVDNGLLQGVPNKDSIKTSAKALYSERHFNPTRQVTNSSKEVGYHSLWETFTRMFSDKIEEAKNAFVKRTDKPDPLYKDSALEDVCQNAVNKYKSLSEKHLTKQNAIAFLGIAALAGLGYYLFKSDDTPASQVKRLGVKR